MLATIIVIVTIFQGIMKVIIIVIIIQVINLLFEVDFRESILRLINRLPTKAFVLQLPAQGTISSQIDINSIVALEQVDFIEE